MSNRAGSRILGSLRAADGAGVVRIEDRYDTGIDDLWSAITDPERIARWYGAVDGDLRPGGTFHLRIEPAELDGIGRIQECDPPRRLVVTTRETEESAARGGGESFEERLEATLIPDGAQTVLTIEVRGLPLDKLAAYGAGWQIHAENLAAYVADRHAGDTAARWRELIPAYANLAPHADET